MKKSVPFLFVATLAVVVTSGVSLLSLVGRSIQSSVEAGVIVAPLAVVATTPATPPPPVFTLAWSEYPSWSTFGVADELGLLNGKEGEQGSIEKEENVDIVLRFKDYDPCIQSFSNSSGGIDFCCMTNEDSLPPSLGRACVAIIPTSTSDGADQIIGSNELKTLADIKGKKIYGLGKSVAELNFDWNCQRANLLSSDFQFTNMDPAIAAARFQQKDPDIEVVALWEPFALETLNKRKDAHVIADSKAIPGIIVDMVVASQDSLQRPGGDRAARAIIKTFYAINKRIADPKQEIRDDTMVALGEKFAHFTPTHMREVLRKCKFYAKPEDAIALFDSPQHKKNMNEIVDYCAKKEWWRADKRPIIAYGPYGRAVDASGNHVSKPNLRFDTTYIRDVMTSSH